jgi:hypothetical protein
MMAHETIIIRESAVRFSSPESSLVPKTGWNQLSGETVAFQFEKREILKIFFAMKKKIDNNEDFSEMANLGEDIPLICKNSD